MARRSRRLPKFLEQPELHALIAAARESSPLDYALIIVLYYAGLRVGEVCALQWGDIGERRLHIRHGKGDKERYVPAHRKIREALDAVRPPDHLRHGWVFPSWQKVGHPLTTRWAQRTMERLCLEVGIEREKAHPHVLRHTFATGTYRAKRNLLATKRLLGHSSVQTTEIYTHLVTDDLEETVDALE